MWKNAGREEALVGQDYKDAATLAAMVAPYRHARFSALKLAGDPNNPARFRDDATAARRSCATWVCWLEGGILDLEALAANSELAEALRIWGCANWCHAARRCIECQICRPRSAPRTPRTGLRIIIGDAFVNASRRKSQPLILSVVGIVAAKIAVVLVLILILILVNQCLVVVLVLGSILIAILLRQIVIGGAAAGTS